MDGSFHVFGLVVFKVQIVSSRGPVEVWKVTGGIAVITSWGITYYVLARVSTEARDRVVRGECNGFLPRRPVGFQICRGFASSNAQADLANRLREVAWAASPSLLVLPHQGGIPITKDITLTRPITQWFSFTITSRILSCVDQDLHDRSQGWQHSWTHMSGWVWKYAGILILLLQLTGWSYEMGGHNVLDARQGVLAHNYWLRSKLVPIHWARSQLDVYNRWFATFTQVSGGWTWCLPCKHHPRKGI